jgi:hypothetical protein
VDWQTFLAELRLEIGDTGATPKYGDDLLYIFVRDGIRDYSVYFPLRFDRVQLTAEDGDDRKYELPKDFLSVLFVESPLDNILELRQERPGVSISTPAYPLRYFVDGGYLYLDASPSGADVFLSYYGSHAIPEPPGTEDVEDPEDPEDEEFVFTIPDMDMECLKLYCEARVNVQIRNRQSQLDRFKQGTGQRSDNPITVETEDFFERYDEAIAKRVRPNVVRLYRPRRWK